MNLTRKLITGILCSVLVACSTNANMSDLQNEIAALKKKIRAEGGLLDTIHFRTPSTFNDVIVNSPFPQTSDANVLLLNRPPVERYPLDALHLIGIIQTGTNAFAVIQTPDNKTYQLKSGDIIGNLRGKITSISAYEVTLIEPSDPASRLSPRTLTLQLKAS